ncbi:MAG: SPOR domain-containing protein [Bacteroidota bacterium]
MKSLVFVLVLANLLFYAYSAGHFGRPDNPDAERLDQQVAPERMRLVSRGEAPPVKAVEAPPPAPPPEAEAAPATVEKTCLRWEQLTPDNARQLSTRLGEQFADYQQSKRTVADEGNGWWVFIPPLPNKAEAEKKAGELRQLGIADYFIIPEEGPNRFAISLGVFSSEKGGQERLADLKSKGVKSARFSARPSKESSITLEASGPRPERAALLKMAGAILPKNQAQDCK